MIRPGSVFMIPSILETMYNGIMMASNGIIIVDMIDMKTTFLPLKLNFARP